ncbi:MAG: hypothetical protein Hals2KO_14280 [Halioglobus sp.]
MGPQGSGYNMIWLIVAIFIVKVFAAPAPVETAIAFYSRMLGPCIGRTWEMVIPMIAQTSVDTPIQGQAQRRLTPGSVSTL